MNRTLRRPMFRMGGAAEGITSGLAPRQGYANNNASDQRVQQAPRTGLRDFLINFGLDLASRPPSGSIFSTAAAAAKDPFKQYQVGKVAREERDYERQWEQEGRDIQEEQFGKKLEQDRYLGELAAQGEKQFLETQIDNYWDPLIEAETDPTKKKQLEKDKASEKYKIIVEGFDVSDQYKILTNEAAYSQALSAAEAEMQETPNPKTGKPWVEGEVGYQKKLQELINKYLRLASEFLLEEEKEQREGGASGGRVGYQNAGAVGEGQNVLQGEGAAVQEETNEINISYEQLRERLPQEISNEIVLLLSQSYEAFADFAEIQTQADVNEFNTKYNVQLFLPKQSGA